MTEIESGLALIESTFAQARRQNRATLMPYVPLGYPTPEASLELAQVAVANGADILELGIPFSDPVADGPVIEHATQVALKQGMTTTACLEQVRELRQRGVTVPLMLMGYYNPILAYGETAFCRDSRAAGASGLIVPDLPPEEGTALERACQQNGMAMSYLLAPTSTHSRIRIVHMRSTGFIYLVSVTGVTGARDELSLDIVDFVQRVRAESNQSLAVGFGISTPQQASQVAAIADGVIVGSALVQLMVYTDWKARTGKFIAALRQAMIRSTNR
ncbi:MAG: tryptophan synthase subunit alpha [Anaerolineales bacterium]|nr:tryptophan synthase subunit alpha [Anaerolineales bacterium]